MRAGAACPSPAGQPTKGRIPGRHAGGPALGSRAMHTVRTIDCQYLGLPGFAAAYLIVEGDRAAFVENNTAHAVPLLLKALAEAGLSPEQVEYAFVTHVHLDHAGGSSALMEACPRATLVAHPRAARHLIDPSKLVASATQVYGAERFRQLYGEIRPIDEARVRTAEDGERLRLGRARADLPPHARARQPPHVHPGLRLQRALHRRCLRAHVPRAPDARDVRLSHHQSHGLPGGRGHRRGPPARLRRRRARVPHPLRGAHGRVRDLPSSSWGTSPSPSSLQAEAQASSLSGEDLERFCHERLTPPLRGAAGAGAVFPQDEATWKLLALDLELNAQGVAHAATKQRKA